MKLKFEKAMEVIDGVSGTVTCSYCEDTYPAFRDDGETVVCPHCGNEQPNPFYRKPKERKCTTAQKSG